MSEVMEESEKMLSDLLAVIHGDGGHYEAQHGRTKSFNDAIRKVSNRFAALSCIANGKADKPVEVARKALRSK